MYTEPTFPGLLTLPGNRFAFAAGVCVASLPGECYNPLWLYGPTGAGKTALLRGILQQLREKNPPLRIRYIQTEDFLRRYLLTTQYPGVLDFRDELSELDVLVVDHLDSLADKPFTQQTVGKLLADLVAKGCQVILASIHTPSQMHALAGVLDRRCPFTLPMEISAPNPRERLALTRAFARELEVPLTSSMAPRIAFAGRSPSHIRCLMTQLSARKQLLGPEAGDLREALDHILKREAVV